MIIEKELRSIELPAIYKREGIDCYFDPYRKKLIKITPEETVRQKVATYFVKKLGIPQDMISLEVPMSHFIKGVSGRADIVVYAVDSRDNNEYPILVVECKNQNVYLTHQVFEQANRYCNTLLPNYLALTNGVELKFAAFSKIENKYLFLSDVPTYKQMLTNDYVLPEVVEQKPVHFSAAQLSDQDLLSEYNESGPWIFGSSTVPELRSFAVSFYQALMDYEHKLPVLKNCEIELIEDLGERFLDYGNAGGGHYLGAYRSFLVKDRLGEPQVVSISIFGTDAGFRGENRTSYTSITVSVDKYKISHNSLQLNVNKYASVSSDAIRFTHNGVIGGFKSSDVVDKIKNDSKQIKYSNKGIELGVLKRDSILYLDNEEVARFIYNLIDYALLRDEVRTNKRSK